MQLNITGVSLSGWYEGKELFRDLRGEAMSTNGPMALGGSYNEMLFNNIEISELPPVVPAAGSVVGEILISPYGQVCAKYSPQAPRMQAMLAGIHSAPGW